VAACSAKASSGYPHWPVQALFENQWNRYEVLLLNCQQTLGVHLVRTVAEFQRAVL
jgi:hypothetical protein